MSSTYFTIDEEERYLLRKHYRGLKRGGIVLLCLGIICCYPLYMTVTDAHFSAPDGYFIIAFLLFLIIGSLYTGICQLKHVRRIGADLRSGRKRVVRGYITDIRLVYRIRGYQTTWIVNQQTFVLGLLNADRLSPERKKVTDYQQGDQVELHITADSGITLQVLPIY